MGASGSGGGGTVCLQVDALSAVVRWIVGAFMFWTILNVVTEKGSAFMGVANWGLKRDAHLRVLVYIVCGELLLLE